MRTLVITNLYPPHHYGGYELLCRDAVDAWRDRGHDVLVLCTDHRVVGRVDEAEPGVERSLQFYWRDFEILRPPLRTRFRIERANRARWLDALEQFRPDVVSVWNYGMFGFPMLAEVVRRQIPLVLVIGDLWPCWGPVFDPWTSAFDGGRAVRRVLGRVVERVTGIPKALPDLGAHSVALPASEWLRSRIERDSPFRFAHMTVVPHGFDARDFPIVEPAVAVARPFGWNLLLPGRLDERKGWRTAVQALTALPDASLTLAGAGDERERVAVRAVAAALGVGGRVQHLVVERSEMAALYRDADVVLFPSEWEEPFGIVGLEAMASGTPVVATATGGSAEYLHDASNCLQFPVGDPAALADAVRRLADDLDLRRRLIENGTATAARYTEADTIRALETWHLAASDGSASHAGLER